MSQEITMLASNFISIPQNTYTLFYEKPGCLMPDDSLAISKIKQVKVIGNNTFFEFIPAKDEYLKQAKKALELAASPMIIACVLPKIHIVILQEQVMQHFAGMQDYSAAYIPDRFSILLNEHLFKDRKNSKPSQQLIGVLRNELSHAQVHTTHLTTHKTTGSTFDIIKPWTNSSQKERIMQAYEAFSQRIARYKELSQKPHRALSLTDLRELLRYRRAIDSFKPKQLGSKAHTVMQEFVTINHQTNQVILRRNIHSKPPARDKIKQRRRYMETAFFREKEQATLHGISDKRPYATLGNTEEDLFRLWADKISDFDQLSPAMQNTFGPELCSYLQDFHQTPSHCDFSLGM